MVDITGKNNTLRIAIAGAVVKVGSSETITAIEQGQVPKGDVFEMSKAAALLGVKKTPELLPDCHPLPIESTRISYEIMGLEIHIKCEVKTIYKTGVEVEAMHGASIAALNMYDMLKPIDKQIEISSIKLLSKKGGKSSRNYNGHQKKALVVVCSDRVSSAQAEDVSGGFLEDLLSKDGVELLPKEVVADEIVEIQEKIKQGVAKADIVLITGGTGLAQRDRTPEALLAMLDTRIPGIEETMRNYGQQRNPLAMFSRSVAGLIDQTLILAFPGSTKGVEDCYKAVFPGAFHLIDLIKGNPKH